MEGAPGLRHWGRHLSFRKQRSQRARMGSLESGDTAAFTARSSGSNTSGVFLGKERGALDLSGASVGEVEGVSQRNPSGSLDERLASADLCLRLVDLRERFGIRTAPQVLRLRNNTALGATKIARFRPVQGGNSAGSLTNSPVFGLRNSLYLGFCVKSNMLSKYPAIASRDPPPIRPSPQLSSIKRITEAKLVD